MSAPLGSGNHALQDYQLQLLLLEQRNKQRLMKARQEQDNMTLDQNDKPLLQPRLPPRQQSDLRHGLPTPHVSPTNSRLASHVSPTKLDPLTPPSCPSPRTSTSNAPLEPNLTRQTYNLPSYPPSKGVSNPPPLTPDLRSEYEASTFKPKLHDSFDLRRRLIGPGDSAHSTESSRSMESMVSSRTYDTEDLEVLTPKWDEPLDLEDSSGSESRSEAFLNQDFGFNFAEYVEPDFKEHCSASCIKSSPSPPNTTNDVLRLSMTISRDPDKTPGQVLTYDHRQPPSSSLSFRSGSETCSWFSDNETDWGDGESDNTYRTIGTLSNEESNILGEQELPNLVARPVLSKIKQELVDRIMVEFWQIFNLDKEINGDENRKRKRQSEDEDENDETEKRNPKRPKDLFSPPRNQDDTRKFACPYRKHDAKKYCVRLWRSCALTPLETVARVKGHLYRHHRIFPCQRCKKLFNDQQGVNDHLMEPAGCMLLEVVQQDGITNEMVEKLRSKKKAHRDQSEEDRWKEIYQILFPEELTPSPFFEEIQEDMIHSPDSQNLADYEDYCRRELPRVFRASLEEIVNNKTQPLEEQLRSQLMDLIRDAQDQVFSRYRSFSTTTGPRAGSAPSSSPQTNKFFHPSKFFETSPLGSRPAAAASSGHRSQAQLPPFFQPPSPKNHLESGLDISDPNMTHPKPLRNNRSDSGYESSPFVMPSTLPLIPDNCSANNSASSSQTLLLPEGSRGPTSHDDSSEVPSTQEKLDLIAETITSAGNDHPNSEFYISQNTFDFEFDYADFSNLDTNDEFENYDLSQIFDEFC